MQLSFTAISAPNSGGTRGEDIERIEIQGHQLVKAWPYDTYWLEKYFESELSFDTQLKESFYHFNKINYCHILERQYDGKVEPSSCAKFTTATNSSNPLKWMQPLSWAFPAEQNGCGSGAWTESATSYLSRMAGFTGELDEPVRGASFLNACNGHGRCYANQNSKVNCDTTFLRELRKVYSITVNESCDIASGVYAKLVKNYGSSAYRNAGVVRVCKALRKAAEKNCP